MAMKKFQEAEALTIAKDNEYNTHARKLDEAVRQMKAEQEKIFKDQAASLMEQVEEARLSVKY